jgi:Tryptophan halogenase
VLSTSSAGSIWSDPVCRQTLLASRETHHGANTTLDAVVIGGRPAGAVCAATLAKQGCSVMVRKRRAFPRFHIGESMLPYMAGLLEWLGLLDAVRFGLRKTIGRLRMVAVFRPYDGLDERHNPRHEGDIQMGSHSEIWARGHSAAPEQDQRGYRDTACGASGHDAATGFATMSFSDRQPHQPLGVNHTLRDVYGYSSGLTRGLFRINCVLRRCAYWNRK